MLDKRLQSSDIIKDVTTDLSVSLICVRTFWFYKIRAIMFMQLRSQVAFISLFSQVAFASSVSVHRLVVMTIGNVTQDTLFRVHVLLDNVWQKLTNEITGTEVGFVKVCLLRCVKKTRRIFSH